MTTQADIFADKAFEKVGRLLNRWSFNAIEFVEEAIGVRTDVKNGLIITDQQREYLKILPKLAHSKLKLHAKAYLTKEEKELSQKWGISVMSGQGTGKAAVGAWTILWFMSCFPRPKILCTAPVADSLRNILWPEVTKWLNHRDSNGNYACKVRDWFEVQTDKIYYKQIPKSSWGKEWFCLGRTASPNQSPDEQVETLSGYHEDHLLYIADEASGIPDPVFKPLTGGLTQKCNFIVLYFNPTKRTGFAIQTQFGKGSENWVKLQWDSEKSPLVSKQHIKDMEDKYGRESNTFRIRVKGVPPVSDDGTLIPWDWVFDSVNRDIKVQKEDPIILSVDCAGYGEAKAIILVRQGMKVIAIYTYNKLNTIELAGWVLEKINYHEPDVVYIDSIGLGAGVYDQVKDVHKERCYPINVCESPSRIEKFDRLRDELWWKTREMFENRLISIPDDQALIEQLCGPRYNPDKKGKIKIESKQEMKKRGLHSPDKADALVMTFFRPDSFYRQRRAERLDPYLRNERRYISRHEHDWMYV